MKKSLGSGRGRGREEVEEEGLVVGLGSLLLLVEAAMISDYVSCRILGKATF